MQDDTWSGKFRKELAVRRQSLDGSLLAAARNSTDAKVRCIAAKIELLIALTEDLKSMNTEV